VNHSNTGIYKFKEKLCPAALSVAREAKGLRRFELARKCKVDTSFIADLENGKITYVKGADNAFMQKLCDATGMLEGWFYRDVKRHKPIGGHFSYQDLADEWYEDAMKDSE